MQTIKEQIEVIIYFFLFGVFSITLYTIFSFTINKTKTKKIWLYLFELIFWVFLTFLSTHYLLEIMRGDLPFYGIVSYLIGIVIYLYFLDKRLKKDLENIYQIFLKFFIKTRKIWSIILIPKEIIKLFKRKKGENNNEEVDNVNNDIN